MKKPLN